MPVLVTPRKIEDATVREFSMLIDGTWGAGADGRTLERVAPGHGVVVSRYQQASAADAERGGITVGLHACALSVSGTSTLSSPRCQ